MTSVREYLKLLGDDEVNRFKFGKGPNYRIRVVPKALEHLDLPPALLRHQAEIVWNGLGTYSSVSSSLSPGSRERDGSALKLADVAFAQNVRASLDRSG
jgi:hypothetical protein